MKSIGKNLTFDQLWSSSIVIVCARCDIRPAEHVFWPAQNYSPATQWLSTRQTHTYPANAFIVIVSLATSDDVMLQVWAFSVALGISTRPDTTTLSPFLAVRQHTTSGRCPLGSNNRQRSLQIFHTLSRYRRNRFFSYHSTGMLTAGTDYDLTTAWTEATPSSPLSSLRLHSHEYQIVWGNHRSFENKRWLLAYCNIRVIPIKCNDSVLRTCCVGANRFHNSGRSSPTGHNFWKQLSVNLYKFVNVYTHPSEEQTGSPRAGSIVPLYSFT